MSKHLLIVDANGFAHRAYHASNPTYRKDGLPTWAVVGFMAMLWTLRARASADQPTHGVAVFDPGGKTFRHDLYPDYKANRNPARREELNAQLPYMRHAAHTLGFETMEVPGFEGDDVIATLAKMASEAGFRTTIVSQDKDFCQCIRDGWVEVVDPVQRKRVLEADVLVKFGVPPALVPDVQAIWGDSVDNIPGIEGVGGKTAGQLIAQFGSLDLLLAATRQSGRIVGTPMVRKALRKNGDNALLYRTLATLRTDVPVDADLNGMALQPVENGHLKEMLRVLEADHKFDVMFTNDPSVTVRVPHTDAPLVWWNKASKNPQGRDYPDQPQDGFYKRRLVRGGPWVAARIWREPEKDIVTDKPTGLDVVWCEVAGKPRNAAQQWDALGRFPIPKAEFDYLVANSQWAKQFAPNSSEANPEKKIDWLREPLE